MVSILRNLLLIFSLVVGVAQAASIEVSVDRNPVQLNESFSLIFQASSDVDDDPDFTPLQKDFDILSQGKSSNVQIINGSMSRQTRWTVNAMAKRVGTITIPVIQFGSDKSRPAQLQVVDQAATNNSNADNRADLILEARVDQTSAFVQAQVVYTIRFYRAVNINGASMTEPKISGADASIEKLGDDAVFETQRQGRRYIVVERKYAVFAQQSGSLNIAPIDVSAQVIESQGNFGLFDRNVVSKRVRSNPIALTIKPIPANAHGQYWLPARQLTISEDWPTQTDFKVGEPITRTLTLKATGLTGAQLPELMTQPIDGFKTYPDQAHVDNLADNQGITGIRQQKIALIPTREGELVLPAITLPWWNTQSNRMEQVTLPARTLHIGAGSLAGSPASISSTPDTIAPAIESAPHAEPQSSAPAANSHWFWIALALGLGWLISTLVLLRKLRRTPPPQKSSPQSATTPTASLREVLAACEQNNAALTRETLLRWGQARWPEQAPTSLDELAQRLGPDVKTQCDQLNRALYSQSAHAWNSAALAEALRMAEKPLTPASATRATALPRLYPES
ncbi:MAG: BatD family protein [Gammaproteobacteria bacterium]|nr:BatD family protein [Gammaproteobacteria bacterium]